MYLDMLNLVGSCCFHTVPCDIDLFDNCWPDSLKIRSTQRIQFWSAFRNLLISLASHEYHGKSYEPVANQHPLAQPCPDWTSWRRDWWTDSGPHSGWFAQVFFHVFVHHGSSKITHLKAGKDDRDVPEIQSSRYAKHELLENDTLGPRV